MANGAQTDQGEKVSPRRTVVWVLPLLLLAGVAFWFWSARAKETMVETGTTQSVKGTLHLETFVLNLADDDQRSYLRIGIDLGLNHELKRDDAGPPIARIRDTILGVLAQSTVEDLLTAKGKTKLKEDLLHALQGRIPDLGTEEIYFTEFLIQR